MSKDAAESSAVPSAYQRLAAQFDIAAHKKVKKGGREQTYIPWTDKVERFNEVLGHDWSFRVIREGLTDTEAWVLGELSVTINGVTTVRQQYGCESITRGQSASPVTDLFKIAGTDALSKAATLFGCGLYLSVQEERAEVEAAMQAAVRAAAAERRGNPPQPQRMAPAATSAAGRGSTVSRSVDTPSTPPAEPSSSSTTATSAPLTSQVDAAARLTGAAETPLKQWERLVDEAEAIGLPKLGAVKAVDARALSVAQLNSYIGRLNQSIATFRGQQQGAA